MTPGITARSRCEGQLSVGMTKLTATGDALVGSTRYPAYPGLLFVTAPSRGPGTMPRANPAPAGDPLAASPRSPASPGLLSPPAPSRGRGTRPRATPGPAIGAPCAP